MVFGCELRKPSVTDQEDETALIYLPSRKCHKLYLFELLGAILFAGLLLLVLVWSLYYPPTSENNLKIQIVDRFLIGESEFDEMSGATDIPVKIEEYKPQTVEEYVSVKDSSQLGEYPDTGNVETLTDAKLQKRSLFSKKLRVRKAAEKKNDRQHPKLIRIPRNASIEENGTSDTTIVFEKEESTSCLVPKGLNTAEIHCEDSPKARVCKSHCKNGSTFHEGETRKHSCIHRKNRWSKPFEECKPIAACKTFVLRGSVALNCQKRASKAIFCYIRCESREEDGKDPKINKHVCGKDGTWMPPMPFCIRLLETYVEENP